MSDLPNFTIDVAQNEYLPEGGERVNAVVTVEGTGGPGTGAGAGAVGSTAAEVIIIIDTSGSMGGPGPKMSEAQRAAQTAIDTLREGVGFAVVSGSNYAHMVYPKEQRLVPVTGRTRAEAKSMVDRLRPSGGTAIGTWLRMAVALFGNGGGVRHAILLTDGKNQHETPQQLDAALAECAGRFVCDCRGVGTDWKVDELRKVASELLGSVGMVVDPKDLAADFRAMTEAVMGKVVADVALRVWTPQGARLRFVEQVMPTVEDLTGKRVEVGSQRGDYPTGAWGAESRDYHVCVEVRPGKVGEEMLAARVSLVLPALGGKAEVLAQGLVRAVWTDDEARSTQINQKVAHYTGQAELAQVIQEGIKARQDGDLDTATARLGRAVALAHASGNEETAKLLAKVVDIQDPATGTVRLKKQVEKADEMMLDTRSTKTARMRNTEA